MVAALERAAETAITLGEGESSRLRGECGVFHCARPKDLFPRDRFQRLAQSVLHGLLRQDIAPAGVQEFAPRLQREAQGAVVGGLLSRKRLLDSRQLRAPGVALEAMQVYAPRMGEKLSQSDLRLLAP